MSDRAELDELARRYLDLWQNQVSALAEDPEFVASLHRMMQAMGLGAAMPWPSWPGAGQGTSASAGAERTNAEASREDEDGNRRARGGAAAGTATAASAFGDRFPDMADLLRRLADLEKRVAALEGPKSGGGAQKRARKRRS